MNAASWVEVSRSSLRHNLREFRRIAGPATGIMAVVKSNAYGHGLEAAKVFEDSGADWLGVANDEEADALLNLGLRKPILILSYWLPNNDRLKRLGRRNVRFSVYRLDQAVLLSRIAYRIRKTIRIHMKIDTGTSRIGFLPSQTSVVFRRIAKLPGLAIEGVFSHLADSENPHQHFTNEQLRRFDAALADAKTVGVTPKLHHIACTASALLNAKSRRSLVRIGIGLYGLSSIEPDGNALQRLAPSFRLKPALSWKTRVIQVKRVKTGETIGYGRTVRARSPRQIAVLPVGYWDGYDRRLSNRGTVLIRDRTANVIGRVCMNLFMVDVTNHTNVRLNDEVVLLGRQGREVITADDLAENINTINYEIVTRINPTITRVLIP